MSSKKLVKPIALMKITGLECTVRVNTNRAGSRKLKSDTLNRETNKTKSEGLTRDVTRHQPADLKKNCWQPHNSRISFIDSLM